MSMPPPVVDDNLSDDDNIAVDVSDLVDVQQAGQATAAQQAEDPLQLAIDDLEGRVVTALDDVKLHPGIRTSTEVGGAASVQEELTILLRPVLEVAAHTGPSVARTYVRGVEGVEASVEEVYQRLISDLVLPVLLEMAQSETIPAKRGASVEFFRLFYKECLKAGSWLDITTTSPLQAGPYGPGSSLHHTISPSASAAMGSTPAQRALLKRRQTKRLTREGEILRYWVEASMACTVPGVFTSDEAEGAVASRGIIAASNSLRPLLRHVTQRIKDADDRGATKLFVPAMKMVAGVLKKFFSSTSSSSMMSNNHSNNMTAQASLQSSCIKFLEIVIFCCSRRPPEASSRRRSPTTTEDFALDDLPDGHPVITREALESIADYGFTVLRGLTLMGGQSKTDPNLMSSTSTSTLSAPAELVVSLLRPAALSYLEIESSLPRLDTEQALQYELDRANTDYDFLLAQKPYAVTINAMSALAVSRPAFFKEVAICLSRRAVQPPSLAEGGGMSPLTSAAALALTSHLKASCLTLLRNPLSIASNVSDMLCQCLKTFDMEIQAEKALSMARHATALKTAGRAARNRANMYYEWDASETDRVTRRQKETDDALAKLRAAKAARGLGHGIQLPTNMSDAIDLLFANLTHLPSKRPSTSSSAKSRKVPITLDYVVDAVMTNGASLSQEEGRWYERDGGSAWEVDPVSNSYEVGAKFLEVLDSARDAQPDLIEDDDGQQSTKRRKIFFDQCRVASADACSRILMSASQSRSKSIRDFGNQIAARLAFTLKRVRPSSSQQDASAFALESVASAAKRVEGDDYREQLELFVNAYPLACAGFITEVGLSTVPSENRGSVTSLTARLVNEALLLDYSRGEEKLWAYDCCVDLFVASAVRASESANEKPNDIDKRRSAVRAATYLQKEFPNLPRITTTSLAILCGMCDIDNITKKAAETARKTSPESIAASAAAHAAKVAAEKRATAALLLLRDAAFLRDVPEIREAAVRGAVGIASGRLPSSPSIVDKALKLTMNVLYTRNEAMSAIVERAAMDEIRRASEDAISSYDAIQAANKEAAKDEAAKNPLLPQSDTEKLALDRMRKPAVLCMALCVRRPENIQELFSLSCVEKADVLAKAVRSNMSKLSRAAAAKHGAAQIALEIAAMSGPRETTLLLAFLESLASISDKSLPDQDIIDACFKIQQTKLDANGNMDPRYIIPVVSAMKRADLVKRLPEFVAADDKVFLAALVRMGDRVSRQALLFREEPTPDIATLHGMTLCEQIVFLHKLDFAAAGLPQKRYLAAIKLCLEDGETYTDSVLMSALDQMSGMFLTGTEKLPLAFMRTCILVCTNYDSLHAFICDKLLPRLVEGKIYEDARQWEGWMRCAHMLEKSADYGVSSLEAIEKLPPEQLMQYRTKWAGK